MAALQVLLPRELLTILVRHPASPPSLQLPSLSIISSHGSRLASAHLDSILSRRHGSSYRPKRTAFDPALAQDFDRPEDGFSYPQASRSAPSPSNATQTRSTDHLENFTEAEDGEYAEVFQLAQHDSDGLLQSHARSHLLVHPDALDLPAFDPSNIYTILSTYTCKAELAVAMRLLEVAPPAAKLGRRARARAVQATAQLVKAALQRHPDDVRALMHLAEVASRKGFAARIPFDLLAHIARFSSYEALQPFWYRYSIVARQHALYYPTEERREKLERGISQGTNRVIRAQVLAGRHVDAVNFLRDVRRGRLSEAATESTPAPAVEAFTYKLLYEEIVRHGAHPRLASEVLSLWRKDWPADRYGDSSEQTSSTPSIARSILRDARRQLQQILKQVRSGTRPSLAEIDRLKSICETNGFQSILQRLDETFEDSPLLRRMESIKQAQGSGEHIPADSLQLFIDECHTSRRKDLLQEMQDWLSAKGPRAKSAWVCAQMARLTRTGRRADATRAIQLFQNTFSMVGVPQELKLFRAEAGPEFFPEDKPAGSAWIDSVPDSPQTTAAVATGERPTTLDITSSGPSQPSSSSDSRRRDTKIWPSSHGLSLALTAYFTLHPAARDVQNVYASLVDAVYRTRTNLPAPMLPDAVTLEVFIHPLIKQGRTDLALELAADMVSRGVTTNTHNWNLVIGGFAREGNTAAVDAILAKMEESKLSAQAQAQAGSHQTSSSSSNAQDGTLAFFDQGLKFPRAGTPFTPGTSPWTATLAAVSLPPPDIVTYTTVIRGLALAKNVRAAAATRTRLLRAQDAGGRRIYRPGENAQTDKALEILASMDQLDVRGQLLQQSREARLSG